MALFTAMLTDRGRIAGTGTSIDNSARQQDCRNHKRSNSNNHMANVKPLADRVLVEAAAAEETTKGGIIIPDTAKEKPQRGKIIAVGSGRIADDGKVTPLTVKVGDEILYGKYSGTELSLEGKDFLIMRESDIYAVLN
jgi:chaperonin GroES